LLLKVVLVLKNAFFLMGYRSHFKKVLSLFFYCTCLYKFETVCV
jgi:hypothetical protein